MELYNTFKVLKFNFLIICFFAFFIAITSVECIAGGAPCNTSGVSVTDTPIVYDSVRELRAFFHEALSNGATGAIKVGSGAINNITNGATGAIKVGGAITAAITAILFLCQRVLNIIKKILEIMEKIMKLKRMKEDDDIKNSSSNIGRCTEM